MTGNFIESSGSLGLVIHCETDQERLLLRQMLRQGRVYMAGSGSSSEKLPHYETITLLTDNK